jgi:hypothetical protein
MSVQREALGQMNKDEAAAITIEGVLQRERTMTFEEMRAVVDALIDEGDALVEEAEKVLARVPFAAAAEGPDRR